MTFWHFVSFIWSIKVLGWVKRANKPAHLDLVSPMNWIEPTRCGWFWKKSFVGWTPSYTLNTSAGNFRHFVASNRGLELEVTDRSGNWRPIEGPSRSPASREKMLEIHQESFVGMLNVDVVCVAYGKEIEMNAWLIRWRVTTECDGQWRGHAVRWPRRGAPAWRCTPAGRQNCRRHLAGALASPPAVAALLQFPRYIYIYYKFFWIIKLLIKKYNVELKLKYWSNEIFR